MSCGDCGGRGIGFGPAVPVAVMCSENAIDPASNCQPKRTDDDLCILAEITSSIDYTYDGTDLVLSNPQMPTNGDVIRYLACWGDGPSEAVLGNGSVSHAYAGGAAAIVYVVLSDGENSVTLAVDTTQAAGTATLTKAVEYAVVREVDCDDGVRLIRCLTNTEITGTVVKCGSGLVVDCDDVSSDCCPAAGDEVVVGAGSGLDLISGSAGAWTPGANQIVAALSVNVKVVGDANNPPVFTDSRGVATPIAQPMELSWAAPSDWGAPSFTNVPNISHSVGDVICVAWTYAETAIL